MRFDGVTRPFRHAEVRPRVGGVLAAAKVQIGSPVKAGDLLFQFDDRPFVAEVATQAARLRRAEDRVHDLPGAARAAMSRGEAEEEYQAALAAKRFADADLEATAIIAPIAGIVSERSAAPGNRYEVGDVLATIAQLEPVQVDIEVKGHEQKFQDWARTHPGRDYMPIRIAAPFFPRTLFGRVALKGATRDRSTDTDIMHGEVASNPRTLALKGGMPVQVRFDFGDPPPHMALLIPRDAIVAEGDARFAVVAEDDGTTRRRPIQLGVTTPDGLQEVVQGIDARSRIVLNAATANPPDGEPVPDGTPPFRP